LAIKKLARKKFGDKKLAQKIGAEKFGAKLKAEEENGFGGRKPAASVESFKKPNRGRIEQFGGDDDDSHPGSRKEPRIQVFDASGFKQV
jgi:hypothetical protein